jgi:hypothetical protein
MAVAEHRVIRSRMALELASISIDESQSNLWNVNAANHVNPFVSAQIVNFDSQIESLRYLVFRRYDIPGYLPDVFVAGLPMGATTGVLRQHITRLRS